MYNDKQLQERREQYVRDHNWASSGKPELNGEPRGAWGVIAPDFTNYVEFSDMMPTDGEDRCS